MHRSCVRVAAIVLSLLAPFASHASADWLIAQSQADGSIARSVDVATVEQSTAEAITALRQVGRADAVAGAEAYLAQQTHAETESLARRIIAASLAGQSSSSLVADLLARQNQDGGFGDGPGYESNAIDTAFALQALVASNNTGGTPAGFAVGYLLQKQSGAGAWNGVDGTPSVYATALALRAVWSFRARFNVAASVESARNWLLGQRVGSLWSEPHLSALALTAILPTLADRTALTDSVAALEALRAADGSIGGDVYTTALALQASSLAELPFPDRVVISGRVIDGDTSSVLPGAQIVISGPASATLTSDADGRFRFESAIPGTYSFSVSLATYSPLSATTTLRAGQIADFGDLALLRGVVPTTAVLRGRVTDDVTGLPIDGARVELAGPALATTTSADGQYEIAGIPVGPATITVSRDGYSAVQGSVNFVAGQVYNFSPQLRVAAASFVAVEGIVTDAESSAPLAGVTITATVDENSVAATTDATGAYVIENLPAGALTVEATLEGFHPVSGTTNAVAGTRVQFSPALTAITAPPPPPPSTGEIVGFVVDSVSGAQLSGVTVQFVVPGSTTRSATTDVEGRFRLQNVAGTGELRFSRSSYGALTIPLTAGAGTILSMGAIELVPTSLNNGGAFRGVVFDALTNAPRSGVTVTAVFGGTTRTASTNSAGAFQFTGINPLEGTARFTRTGYETLDIGLSLNLGEIVELGTVYMRPVDTDEVRGDLIVQTIDIAGVSSTASDFRVSGAVQVGIQNSGVAPLAGSINVKAFSDLNRDGDFDAGVDTDLGNAILELDLGPGSVQQVSIPLSGVLPFRDAPLSIWVDSENVVIEQSETNNFDTTAGICGNAQRLAVDLGLCMDSSGSISAADFQLQLQGTAAAIENPAIVPHDGSVRLTVMQFDSATRVEVPPTILDESNAATLAERIRAIRKSNGGTSIHSCINTATQQLSGALPRAAVRVIDLATDGGSSLAQAQQAATNAQNAGIDALNALAVGSGADLNVLNAIVFPRTGGPDDGFVVEIDTFEEYAQAIAMKIRRETRTADLTVGGLKVIDEGDSVTLQVRVGNGGSRTIPAGAIVSFYAGEPGSGVLLGQFTLPQLTTGEFVDVSLPGITALVGGETVVAIADEAGVVGECNTSNNRFETASGILRGALSVATDASVYAPNAPVLLMANITNQGHLAGSFRYQLQIEDAAGVAVATFALSDTDAIASGATATQSHDWNTGLFLAGTYTLRGVLMLQDGTPLAQASSTFEIRHDSSGAPEASLRVATDRSIYNTTDTVAIEALARNLTHSTLMVGMQVRLTVRTSDDTLVLDRTLTTGDLLGGNAREVSTLLGLVGASEGEYEILGSLIDAEGVLRASATATFTVTEDIRSTLAGVVVAALDEVTAGSSQLCTSTIDNRGTRALTDETLRLVALRLEDAQVLSAQEFTIDLAAGGRHVDVRNVSTAGFGVGDHACALQARVGDAWVDLGYDTFAVTELPIRIESDISVGERGRVLVLVDAHDPSSPCDPYSPCSAPNLATQRAHIEAVLEAAGWSYTIVDSASDFETEFDTNGYQVFALLSEEIKLSVALQQRINAAVQAGAGLVLAGNHDRRNSKLEAALGIKSLGKNLDVKSLIIDPSNVMGGGEEAIDATVAGTALETRLEGATPFARYRLRKGSSQPVAATTFAYGEGRSVYVSMDLPMAGAAAGDDSLFAQLFASALAYVHPEEISPIAHGVLPLKITLTNEGDATAGRVLLSLPSGVTPVDVGAATILPDGSLEWLYALESGEVLELDAWVRLPAQPGDVTVVAQIQTGAEPDYVDYDEVALTVRVVAQP